MSLNIRRLMADEIAERIQAKVLDQLCDCGWPLMEKANQAMPFCWGCTTDRITAQRGRDVLTKVRLAARGILIEEVWVHD